MTDKEKFIKAYTAGWHDCGRMNGVYLWDIDFKHLSKDIFESISETAGHYFDSLQGKHGNS